MHALLLSLLALVPHQASAPGLSLDYPATRLQPLLADLSQKSNAKLTVSKQLEETPLILIAKDRPLQEILDQIARVVNGRWDKVEGGFHLVPDRDKAQAEQKARIDERRAAIAKALDELRERHVDPPLDPKAREKWLESERKINQLVAEGKLAEAQKIRAERGKAPEVFTRGIGRLILLLGADKLAQLENHDRLVYATSPTRAQQAFPPGFKQAIKSLEEDMAVSSSPEAGKLRLSEAQKTLLTLENDTRGIDVRLHFLGSSKLTISYYLTFQEPAREPSPVLKAIPSSAKLELSEFSLELSRLYSRAEGFELRDPVSSETQSRLLSPATTDPLSAHASDVCRSIAKAADRSVVALVPDSFLHQPPKPGASLETAAKTVVTGATTINERWITIRPNYLSTSDHADRERLGAVLRSMDSSSYGGASEWAAYASAVGGDVAPDAARALSALLVPRESNELLKQDWRFLRFYGSLSNGQRNALESGTPLSVGSLPQAAKQAMTDLVYRHPVHLFPDPDTVSPLGSEPTQSLPVGIPADGTVYGKRATTEGALATLRHADGRAYGPVHMSFGEIGRRLASSEFYPDSPHLRILGGEYRLASREWTDYLFLLGPAMLRAHIDWPTKTSGKAVPLEDLPIQARERILEAKQAELEKLRKGNGRPS